MFTNLWYVAARSDALDKGSVIQRRMLGREFALFRKPDESVACLSAVNPHRGSNLATGVCHEDGTLACPFHGKRFDSEGRCTMIPSLENPTEGIHPSSKVDAYPTDERYGFIWVFLGDDPDGADPIVEMPEFETEGWRHQYYDQVWGANYHYAKMSNMDHVHLPVVHGIQFSGKNPIRPPDHVVERFDTGFQTVTKPRPTLENEWEDVQTIGAPVVSVIKFFRPGITTRGQVEIGGEGSGWFNIFYEFCTPIDERTTHMHYILFRSFMLDEDMDGEHMRRNLKNIHEDKIVAEEMFPRVFPTRPNPRRYTVEREDRLMEAYWEQMETMRQKGWQIDRARLRELERDSDYLCIPSPARRADPAHWVHGEVPRLAE